MHNRVIEVTTEKIEECDFLDYWDLIERLNDFTADSVGEIDGSRAKDIADFLINHLLVFEIIFDRSDESIIFTDGFKDRYFEERFSALKLMINSLKLETFSGSGDEYFPMRDINRLIEDDLDLYIYDEDKVIMPLDSFIRNYMKEGVKYFFGGVVDYKW